MIRSSLRASASNFAHLAGLGRKSRASAGNEDDQDNGRAEDDEDDDKSASDDDDQEPPKDKKGKKAKAGRRADDDDDDDGQRAEDEDDEKDASDDDDQDPPKGKKGKKAKAGRRADDDEDGDDDEDAEDDDDKQEMSGRSAAASARRRERARCAAIFASKHAANNIPLAASLAFDTTMTRKEATAVLKSQAGRSSAPEPRRRSREDYNSDLGADHGRGKPSTAASWGTTFDKIGATKR